MGDVINLAHHRSSAPGAKSSPSGQGVPLVFSQAGLKAAREHSLALLKKHQEDNRANVNVRKERQERQERSSRKLVIIFTLAIFNSAKRGQKHQSLTSAILWEFSLEGKLVQGHHQLTEASRRQLSHTLRDFFAIKSTLKSVGLCRLLPFVSICCVTHPLFK